MTTTRCTGSAASMGSDPIARRELLSLGIGAAALSGLAACAGPAAAQDSSPVARSPRQAPAALMGWDASKKEYVLPPLPYEYNALEPHIDEQTMRLHHDKHHAGYVRGLNQALSKLAAIRNGSVDASEVQHWERSLAFNGSGHALHTTFWNCMSPTGGGQPSGMIAERINRDFGSYRAFADQFKAAAGAVEGSGWGLLVHEPMADRLMIMQAEKHQNLTMWGVVPLVVIDVWEHAYYLKYQNDRKAYVDAFMNVIDWGLAERMLGA